MKPEVIALLERIPDETERENFRLTSELLHNVTEEYLKAMIVCRLEQLNLLPPPD